MFLYDVRDILQTIFNILTLTPTSGTGFEGDIAFSRGFGSDLSNLLNLQL